MLSGKKTYIVGILMIVYSGAMLLLGQMDQGEAVTLIMEGVGFITVRIGIKKGAE